MTPIDVVVVGSYVQDHAWRTAQFPAAGESRIGTFSTGPGGKGFNQAVACHKQGVKTCFLGALGDDRLGEIAQAYAREIDLLCDWEVVADTSTAASSIVVNARGENLIVVALGANEALSAAFIQAHDKLLRGAKVVICQLENALDATRAALTLARASGAVSVLNPAPINEGVDAELLALADIITPNETEFAFLMRHCYGKSLEPNYWEMPNPLLHQLCRVTGIGTVVITLGDKGCFVSHAEPLKRKDGDAYYRLSAETVRAIDTTGAGDAFSGGLAAGMIHYHYNQPFRRAVVHAGRVAALSTERPGTAPAMPSRADVDARFST
jgi:ribokinase